MVRVVGKGGALGAGVGGKCSSGMDGSKEINIYIYFIVTYTSYIRSINNANQQRETQLENLKNK